MAYGFEKGFYVRAPRRGQCYREQAGKDGGYFYFDLVHYVSS
jgi:hypothetical protein